MPHIKISGKDYEPERIWSRARTVHDVDVSNFGSQASLMTYLEGLFRRDMYLGNLGGLGRRQVVDEALKEWGKVPVDVRLVPLMTMRERGLLSRGEYYEFAGQQGLTAGQAEYRYRGWTGTQRAIWDMKYKGLLRYSEFSHLLKAKGISRGAGYYRYRKYTAQVYAVPFKGWERRPIKPRSRRSESP
jgi:hypothetical protein